MSRFLGRAAYEAYCADSGGRSLVTGEPLPSWERLTPRIREAWRATADGVAMMLQLLDQQAAVAQHLAAAWPSAELGRRDDRGGAGQ